MKRRLLLIVIWGTILLTGCVKKSDHDKVKNDLKESQEIIESAKSEIASLKEEKERQKKEIESYADRLSKAEKDLENIKNSDINVFAKASSTSDRGSKKNALKSFLDLYPSSPLLSKAQDIIKKIENEEVAEAEAMQRKLAQQREEEAERKRQEEAKKKDLELKRGSLISIARLIADQPIYVGKKVVVNGVCELIQYYNYGYDDAQLTHYAFRITGNSYSEHINVYGDKLWKGAASLKERLLGGNKISGSWTIIIPPERYRAHSSDVFAELEGYGPKVE